VGVAVVVWDFCSECYLALVVEVIAGAGGDLVGGDSVASVGVVLAEAVEEDLVDSVVAVQAAAELVAVGSW
jgi:hypothetical protein